jgi:circadian clock protein KaiC
VEAAPPRQVRADPDEVELEKLRTGIDGFDFIAYGGLPRGRSTLVAGTPGSAKTVFAVQYLAAGIEQFGQGGVYVTFEEKPSDIRRNSASFGWDVEGWEEAGLLAFVDAAPSADREVVVGGAFDLGALMSRIEHAVEQTGATRVALDGVTTLFAHLPDEATVRSELFRLVSGLKQMGVTAVVTAERESDEGELSKNSVEDFVADNVVILRNPRENERRRRTIELLKFRGTRHQKGESPFTIMPRGGLRVIPLSAVELVQRSSEVRISSGNEMLDEMCGGGFYRDAIILISGATGTGKTLTTTQFVRGIEPDGRALLFAFEESRPQLVRNAAGWGVDFDSMEADGRLRIVPNYPEVASLEDHLIMVKEEIDRYQPTRLAIDSLSALERAGSERAFREFIIGLTSFVKQRQIAGLFTANTPTLMGGTSVTEAHISTITDLIILLRYVELQGETRRGITVLKMRGSAHDKRIREFIIDSDGMRIGRPFRNIAGILAGHPRQDMVDAEIERMTGLFGDAE